MFEKIKPGSTPFDGSTGLPSNPFFFFFFFSFSPILSSRLTCLSASACPGNYPYHHIDNRRLYLSTSSPSSFPPNERMPFPLDNPFVCTPSLLPFRDVFPRGESEENFRLIFWASQNHGSGYRAPPASAIGPLLLQCK